MRRCTACKKEKPESAFTSQWGRVTVMCCECLAKRKSWRQKRNPGDVYYIYGLFDPITLRCHYIGQTCSPKIRLAQHIRDAKNPNSSTITRERREWTLQLLQNDNKPFMIVMEETSPEKADLKEIEWIDKMLTCGATLYNQLSGIETRRDSIAGINVKVEPGEWGGSRKDSKRGQE